ncbi:HAD family hydrolase [Enterococcus raffinosus]|uniref:HAD hydrolase, family IA n=1 Tax=Enterococcus raffinosus ATCC 49464 TaxID=1158602 RepID=R2RG81_9ENTE|nr:HAD family phosphatase [Enterococcus raffinosus]EOH74979.1 HAD hydrolase, family IA [Enterococcus raffinosus ATCC 49464]EOT82158.1 hypothetical protein I590_00583 [Enterococcus raffinosus ATCC 49464]OJG84638.1 HAD hydrolase, family IA [Enterococcus raffinosus]UXK04594.1 HAD family phosphatase [Enterococcus raffinosus]
MDVKGIIFDMDGVLIDSEPLNKKFSELFFTEKGYVIPKEIGNTFLGATQQEIWRNIKTLFPEVDTDELQREMEEAKDSLNINYESLVFEGLHEMLYFFKQKDLKLAVASSTSSSKVVEILSKCQLHDYFDVIVGGDTVSRSKPHPDIFNYTAKQLQLSTNSCIVIEDSTNGITAARSAGMLVIGKKHDVISQDISQANFIFKSYFELLNKIKSDLFKK